MNETGRRWFRRGLLALLLLAGLLPTGCQKQEELTVAFREDGTVEITYAVTADRGEFDKWLVMRQRTSKVRDGEQTAAGAAKSAKPAAADQEQKEGKEGKVPAALSEQEIKDALQALSPFPSLPNMRIDEATKKKVKVEITRVVLREKEVEVAAKAVFQDYKAFVLAGANTPSMSMVALGQAEEGALTMRAGRRGMGVMGIFGASAPAGAHKATAERLQKQQLKRKMVIEFPGEVLSTTLPNHEKNRAWCAFDCAKEEDAQQAAKLQDEGFEIVARMGQAKLPEVEVSLLGLQQEERQEQERRRDPLNGLPVEEAGAQTMELTPLSTRQVRFFYLPGGKAVLEAAGRGYGMENECTISARLRMTNGMRIFKVLSLNVTKAVDDKGRTVRPVSQASDRNRYNGEEEGAVRWNLLFQNPPGGLRALEQIEGTAELVLFKEWKTLRLGEGTKGKEYDLAALLPGAKMTLTEYRKQSYSNGRVVNVNGNVALSGPAEIGMLSVRAVANPEPGDGGSNGNSSIFNVSSQREGVFSAQGNFNRSVYGDGSDSTTLTLEAALPVEMKRVRIPFHLEGIDFY